jgi:hypothetical protein
MADRVSHEQNPIEAWGKLIESTMSGYSVTPTATKQAQEAGKDPWLALIDQLWKAKPASKLLPHQLEEPRCLVGNGSCAQDQGGTPPYALTPVDEQISRIVIY